MYSNQKIDVVKGGVLERLGTAKSSESIHSFLGLIGRRLEKHRVSLYKQQIANRVILKHLAFEVRQKAYLRPFQHKEVFSQSFDTSPRPEASTVVFLNVEASSLQTLILILLPRKSLGFILSRIHGRDVEPCKPRFCLF